MKLRELAQWLNWREVVRPDGKVDKPPCGSINGKLMTYEEAYARDPKHVGYVFRETDPFAGIDIDAMTPLAQELLAAARERGAFVQRSPSGRGWHIIGLGRLSRAVTKGAVDPGIEAYSQGRYFTMPDDEWTGDPGVDIQDLLDQLESLRVGAADSADQPGQWDETSAALGLMVGHIPAEDYGEWIAVGMALKASGAPLSTWDTWSQGSDKYPGSEAVARKWASFRGTGIGLGSLYMLARKHGWEEPVDDFPEWAGEAPAAEPATGFWEGLTIGPDEMVAEPPPQAWVWDEMVPPGLVTGLAGEGGVAKSTLALQLAIAVALGDEVFLGHGCEHANTAFISVEDDADELRRRVHRMLVIDSPADLVGKLYLLDATEALPMLSRVTKDGAVKSTKRLGALIEYVKARGIRLVVLDLAGDFWDGNENARGEVTAFVRRHLGRLAREADCAVVAVQHLNKSGELSGSTAWSGSFRSVLTMTRQEEGDEVELLRVKSNRARPQRAGEGIRVEWRDGRMVELSVDEREARVEMEVDQWLAALPLDQWMGVDTVREYWGLSRAAGRRRTAELVERGLLEHRTHNHGDQWRVA